MIIGKGEAGREKKGRGRVGGGEGAKGWEK